MSYEDSAKTNDAPDAVVTCVALENIGAGMRVLGVTIIREPRVTVAAAVNNRTMLENRYTSLPPINTVMSSPNTDCVSICVRGMMRNGHVVRRSCG